MIGCALGIGTLGFIPSQIPGESLAAVGDMRSPAFFPIVAGSLILVCSILLAVRALAGRIDVHTVTVERPASVAAVVAIFVLLTVGAQYVGMVTSSALSILAMAVVLGYRNLPVLAVIVISVPLAIYVLFERILRILLPHGALF